MKKSMVIVLLIFTVGTYAEPVELIEKLWETRIESSSFFWPHNNPTVADLDEDGFYEILAAIDSGCYVWRYDGSRYPNFPQEIDTWFFQSTPAVGDIDGDGDNEVVIGARSVGLGVGGGLYAWHHDGTQVEGFPVDGIYVLHTIALADMDDDGALEIVVPEVCPDLTGKMHVFDGYGNEYPGWPRPLANHPTGSVAVGDIDGDEKEEILFGGWTDFWPDGVGALFAFNDDGTEVPGFPFEFPEESGISGAAPTLADFDDDGNLEIACVLLWGWPSSGLIYLLRGNGTVMPGWPQTVERGIMTTPTAADIDDDGYLEVIIVCDIYGPMYVFNYDGSVVPGFPVGDTAGDNVIVADIDDDGHLEMMHDLNNSWTDYDPGIVAYNHDGSPVDGFPICTQGSTCGNPPTVWDVDRDGDLEFVVIWKDPSIMCVISISLYRVGGDPDSVVWPMHKHDQYHTSCYDTDLCVGIDLDYFCAKAKSEGILVRWATSDEYDHAGFNLYRSSKLAVANAKTITSREKLNAEMITGGSPYEYLDVGVGKGVTYNYWLESIDVGGSSETFGPVECTWRGTFPTAYALYQSRPNPAAGNAIIDFDLPETAPVTLTVYDISGRTVRTVVDETLTTGEHEAEVSGLAPGVYVYRLKAGEFNAAKKMVIVE